MTRLDPRGLDLGLTLASGQFLRWRPLDGGYEIRDGDRAFWAAADGPSLVVSGLTAKQANRFFGLDFPAAEAHDALARDRVLQPLLLRCAGLRILRQDPWDCLLMFVLSQASNLPRIRRNLDTLAERFGHGGALPAPGDFPSERDLRDAGVGFRAPYLRAAAVAARGGLLGRLGTLDTETAAAELRRIDGISHKVADCVLLFAYGRMDTFPVDVWVHRAVTRRYLAGRRRSPAAVRDWGLRRFGRWAGYAQQVLFVTARAARGRGARSTGLPSRSATRRFAVPTPRRRPRSAAKPASH